MQRRATTAIVIAYGSPETLADCLDHLGGVDETIVVDNSGLLAARRLAEGHCARYLDPGSNIGFARAVNLAASHARPNHDLLLVNPDAHVAAPVAHALAAALADDPGLAAVAPRLVGLDGRPQRVRWPVPTPLGVWLDAVGLGRLRRRSTAFLVGAVLLIRREAWESIGAFDERFFLYAEESDWQLRAVRAGWRLAVVSRATAMHVGAATSSDSELRERLFYQSAAAFGAKWYGSRGWAVMRAGSLVGAALRVAVRRGDERRAARKRLEIYRNAEEPTR